MYYVLGLYSTAYTVSLADNKGAVDCNAFRIFHPAHRGVAEIKIPARMLSQKHITLFITGLEGEQILSSVYSAYGFDGLSTSTLVALSRLDHFSLFPSS